MDKSVDHSISEIVILQLFTKHKSIGEQADLFPIASSVPNVLTAEYAASIYPLDVQGKDSRVVVRKWDSPLPALFPVVFASSREIGRLVAEQVSVHRVLDFVRPDEYGQSIYTIAFLTSNESQKEDLGEHTFADHRGEHEGSS